MSSMIRFRWFKTLALLLVLSFITLDIAWAYPSTPSDTATLGTQALYQQQMMTEGAERFRQSVFSDRDLTVSVYSVAKCLFEDGLPLEKLDATLTAELGDAARGVDLSKVSMADGVILMEYVRGRKSYVIQIARKDSLQSSGLIGYDFVFDNKYVIKAVPRDYAGEVATSARQGAADSKGAAVEEAAVQKEAASRSGEPEVSQAPVAIVKTPGAARRGKLGLPRAFSIRSIFGKTFGIEPVSSGLMVYGVATLGKAGLEFVIAHPYLTVISAALLAFLVAEPILLKIFGYFSPEERENRQHRSNGDLFQKRYVVRESDGSKTLVWATKGSLLEEQCRVRDKHAEVIETRWVSRSEFSKQLQDRIRAEGLKKVSDRLRLVAPEIPKSFKTVRESIYWINQFGEEPFGAWEDIYAMREERGLSPDDLDLIYLVVAGNTLQPEGDGPWVRAADAVNEDTDRDRIRREIVDEIAERKEMSFAELFAIVDAKVPASMSGLKQALADLKPLSLKSGTTADDISAAIDSARKDHDLSGTDLDILWLAMTGPGQGSGNWASMPVPHHKPEQTRMLSDASARRLVIVDVNSSFMGIGEYREFSDAALDAIVNMMAAGKRVVLFSNDHHARIKKLIERSLRRYIAKKQRISGSEGTGYITFKDCFLYTNQGRQKYLLDPVKGEYIEAEEYRDEIAASDIGKIRAAMDSIFTATARRTIEYRRKDGFTETFDIYGLSDAERDAILRKAAEIESEENNAATLVKAIPMVIIEPRVMINLAEPPSVFLMLYGLMDRAYYYQHDPQFKERNAMMKRVAEAFAEQGLDLKIEIAGSRGIGIGRADKGKVVRDAQGAFGLGAKDSVVIADFSVREENIFGLTADPAIAMVNIGNPVELAGNPLLQMKDMYGNVGGVFWMTLLNEPKLRAERAPLFIERLASVYEMLLDHPEMPSEDIADYFKLTREELVEIYTYINQRDGLRLPLISNSKYKTYTLELIHLLRDRDRLDRVLRGEAVYPMIVEMHLGNACNSDCTMCFSHGIEYDQQVANKRHKVIDGKIRALEESRADASGPAARRILDGIESLRQEAAKLLPHRRPLSIQEIRKLLLDCRANGTEEIWFSGGKEPLMRKNVTLKAIQMANEIGFKTRLYTNGEFLPSDDEALEVLLGCEQVRVSLNAAREETYDKIHFPGPVEGDLFWKMHDRRGKHVFTTVRKNIARFVELRNRRMKAPRNGVKPRVKIAVSQVIQPLNYAELTDFYNMANDLGVDSVQVRAESVGSVEQFTEQQKLQIIAQEQALRRRKALGEFPKLEFESRGLTREDLDASKDSEQFLAGMRKSSLCRAGAFKRGVNPWGKVFNCEYSMHPQNARDRRFYELDTEIGDLRAEGFDAIMQRMGGSFLLNKCSRCQAHEYGMNIALEKFSRDHRWGIHVDEQPYYNASDYSGNVALVGMGRWGATVVLPALLNVLPKNVKIRAVAGSNAGTLKLELKDRGQVSIEEKAGLAAVLKDDSVRTVVITSPFDSHYSLVKEALLAGKDVFVEKPFTRTRAEARELVELARRRGLILAVGYEYMNEPPFFAVRDAIRSGALGDVTDVRLTMLNTVGKRKLDYTSNAVEDLVGHQLSMLVAFFGEEETSKLSSDLRGDGAEITMDYGGKRVSIAVARDRPGSAHERSIEIRGTKGRLVLDYGSPDRSVSYTVFGDDGSEIPANDARFPQALRSAGAKQFLTSQYELFFESVRTRKAPYNSAASVLFIGDLLDEISRMAINRLGVEETGAAVMKHHWDLESVIGYLWHERMGSGRIFKYDLNGVKRKSLGLFDLRYIPGRGAKRKEGRSAPTTVLAPFDASAFNFTSIPAESGERMMRLALPDGTMDLIVNINPFEDGHFIAVPGQSEARPQYLTSRDLLLALELSHLSRTPRFKLIYNSRGAYASVNHSHFQGFSYTGVGGEERMPIERAALKTVAKVSDVTVATVVGYPAEAVVFFSPDMKKLALSAAGYVKILQERNIPHNLLITKDRIYVMPRAFQKDYSATVDDYYIAAIELAGEVVLHTEDAYRGVTERDIIKAITEISLPGDEFRTTIRSFVDIVKAGETIARGGDASKRTLRRMTVPDLKVLLVLLGIGTDTMTGKFLTYSGSSGVGKSTMWELLQAQHGDIFQKELLYTTRPRRFKAIVPADGRRYEWLKRFLESESSPTARAYLEPLPEGEEKAYLSEALKPLYDPTVYGRTIARDELLKEEGSAIRLYNEFEGVHYRFVDEKTLGELARTGTVVTLRVKEATQGFPLRVLESVGSSQKIHVVEADKDIIRALFSDENRHLLEARGIDMQNIDISSFFVLPFAASEIPSRFGASSHEQFIEDIAALLTWSKGDATEAVSRQDLERSIDAVTYRGVAKLIDRYTVEEIRKAIASVGVPSDAAFTAQDRNEIPGFDRFLASEQARAAYEDGYFTRGPEEIASRRSMTGDEELLSLFRISHMLTLEMTRRLKRRANANGSPFSYDAKHVQRIADALEEAVFSVLYTKKMIRETIANRWNDEGIPAEAVEAFARHAFLRVIEGRLGRPDGDRETALGAIAESVVKELAERQEADFPELFDMVYAKVPDAMVHLKRALDEARSLSGRREGVSADTVADAIQKFRQAHNLSPAEVQILRLALLGPGQGGVRYGRPWSKVTDADAIRVSSSFDYAEGDLRRDASPHDGEVPLITTTQSLGGGYRFDIDIFGVPGRPSAERIASAWKIVEPVYAERTGGMERLLKAMAAAKDACQLTDEEEKAIWYAVEGPWGMHRSAQSAITKAAETKASTAKEFIDAMRSALAGEERLAAALAEIEPIVMGGSLAERDIVQVLDKMVKQHDLLDAEVRMLRLAFNWRDVIAPVRPAEVSASGLKSAWSEKMSRAAQLGIGMTTEELERMVSAKVMVGGIECMESGKHRTKNGIMPWTADAKTSWPFDGGLFNFSKLYDTVKPEHLLLRRQLNGRDWYVGMNNMPILKYHMLVVPKVARQQLATTEDLADMQALLADLGDPAATLLHNSLSAGAGINSLHFHLHFYDLPAFRDGFELYGGTGQFPARTFTGEASVREAGEYLNRLQAANQPYNIMMRLGRIIIVPRPAETSFPFGADALAGVSLYGNDRSLEEAAWRKEDERPRISDAKVKELFEIVENTINNDRARLVSDGNVLMQLMGLNPQEAGTERGKGFLYTAMPTAELRARLEILTKAKVFMSPSERELAVSIESRFEKLEADAIVASLIVLARRAKFQNQKLIIGIEKGWIPGLDIKGSDAQKALNPLMIEIASLGETLRRMGLDNVIIKYEDKETLPEMLLTEADTSHTDLTNVVVLGSQAALNAAGFDRLRTTDGEKRAFFAAINAAAIEEFLRENPGSEFEVDLLRMICITLELAAGKDRPLTPLIKEYDPDRRQVVFLPRAKKVDLPELIERAKSQARVLESA